jgi:hypothetical protein
MLDLPSAEFKMILDSLRQSLPSVVVLLFAINFSKASTINSRADTSGCGIARDFAGQTHTGKTIQSSGGTRTYDVYLPPNYDEVSAVEHS